MQNSTFAELGLSAKLLAAVEAAGYSSPTPIQAQAIPVAVTGRDVLGIAQTGTGKTAAFTIPMINRLETGRARARMPRSLILAPTRELAAQVAQSFEKYGINHKLNLALLIGGVSFDEQNAKLDRGVDVLIATPGRLLDQFQRGRILLVGVEILVIDEADRMLDMGFIPDIERICKLLPPKRQTLFFSATMPAEISRLVNQFMKDPTRIEVAPPATTAATITQRFCYCENGEDWAKRETLRNLIANQDVKNAIVFCNRKRDVAILHKSMRKHGFNAGALHGDMDQPSRTATLDAFRGGELQFLIASDVAARGLDIPEVSHIFNFDMPWDADDYVHRIGRTGRAGREGLAASLVTGDDFNVVREIEKRSGTPAEWLGDPPSAEAEAEGASRRRRGIRSRTGGKPSAPSRDRGRSQPRATSSAVPTAGGEVNGKARRHRGNGKPKPEDATVQEIITLGGGAAPAAEAGGEAPPPPAGAVGTASDRGKRARKRGAGGRAEHASNGGDRTGSRAEVPSSATAAATVPARATNAEPQDRLPVARERSQPRQRASRPAGDDEATVGHERGFADNVPAFLRRPVRIGAR